MTPASEPDSACKDGACNDRVNWRLPARGPAKCHKPNDNREFWSNRGANTTSTVQPQAQSHLTLGAVKSFAKSGLGGHGPSKYLSRPQIDLYSGRPPVLQGMDAPHMRILAGLLLLG